MAAEVIIRGTLDREGFFAKGKFEFPSDSPQPPFLRLPTPIHEVIDPLKYPLFSKFLLYGGVELPAMPGPLPVGFVDEFARQERATKGWERYRLGGDPAAWIQGGRAKAVVDEDLTKGMFSGKRLPHPGFREWFVILRFHGQARRFEYMPYTPEDEAEIEEEKASEVRALIQPAA